MKLLLMVWVDALEILLREPEPPGPAAGAPVWAPASSAGVALFCMSFSIAAGRPAPGPCRPPAWEP
ncbi:hypothetical protein, partial [Burkholderia sp. Ap-962]|uniref:hypothetical protein n=1 Tax=Burkholderia sp. Ap-962 TaxID=2608333 RepID=UPI001966C916